MLREEMLREEQIDLRKQRARIAPYQITNLGKNQIFSSFKVRNPNSGGEYEVVIRGFTTGDNQCDCPDFRTNTLGTCKHIEAVLAKLNEDFPQGIRHKKALITQPEITLEYGESIRLTIYLPKRHSDELAKLTKTYFDAQGHWLPHQDYNRFLQDIDKVPEPIRWGREVLDFIEREIERDEMLQKERSWLDFLDQDKLLVNDDGQEREFGIGSENRGINDPKDNKQLNEHSSDHLQWPTYGTYFTTLLKIPLYDYQLRGAIFAACRGRSILADDMGLGKTIQTLAAVEILARERDIRKVLVVAPASVKYQWESEIHKFTDRSVQVVEGLKDQRLEMYRSGCYYLLVNYEQVVRDLEEINHWQADLVVLDEAQRIKNWESKTSRAVKKLRSRYAIVLTGTPLENRLEELYSIVQFVDDRRLGPAFQFLHDHRLFDENGQLIGYRNLDAIREKLAPILLRRTREEVLTQLPGRTDTHILVELSAQQQIYYEEQRTSLARLLQKNILSEIDRKRILACISNLRLICDSSFLYDELTHFSPKLDELLEILEDLIEESDHKIVIFSQWETMLNETADLLQKKQWSFVLLHGGLSGKERKEVLEQFQNNPQCRLFLSTDAGSVGLNLQRADTVINLEVPWNPAVLEQRIARIHRMGQNKPVRVLNFVTRNSIEERVLQAIEVKKEIFAGVFDDESPDVQFIRNPQQGFMRQIRDWVSEPTPLGSTLEPANELDLDSENVISENEISANRISESSENENRSSSLIESASETELNEAKLHQDELNEDKRKLLANRSDSPAEPQQKQNGPLKLSDQLDSTALRESNSELSSDLFLNSKSTSPINLPIDLPSWGTKLIIPTVEWLESLSKLDIDWNLSPFVTQRVRTALENLLARLPSNHPTQPEERSS